MESELQTTVYFTVQEDGTHLATAVAGPCFAVAAATFEEAKARAGKILVFHAKRVAADSHAGPNPELARKLTRAVRPFAPSRVERLPVPQCVAA